jgi:hypothetical protein
LITTATAVTVNWQTTSGNVRVVARNACGSSSASLLAVTFVCRESAGHSISSLQLNAYPNPVKEQIELQLISDMEAPVELSIHDITGRTISSATLVVEAGSSEYSLSAANLSPGVYFLTAIQGGVSRTIKIIKQ